MPRVIHFEIVADDPERAARFYSEIFGWKIEKWNGPVEYWMVMTGEKEQPGIDGGLMRREKPFPPTTNTIDVTNVDEYTERIIKSGGKIVAPKMAIPGVGWMAYCQDTEGNTFGIIQIDNKAK